MLKQLLVSRVRVDIISLFLMNPGQPWHVREITRRVGTEVNAVRRELKRLAGIGFLRRESRGNRVYFEVKKSFLFYEEFLAMVFKERGFGKAVLESKKALGKVKFISVSKAFLEGCPAAAERIDLFFVGDVSLPVLKNLIEKEEERIGREINYTVLTEDEFDFMKKRKDSFLEKILAEPRLILWGGGAKFGRF